MEIQQKILELIFPQGVFKWFDLIDGRIEGEDVEITLEEKDNPPIEGNQKVIGVRDNKFFLFRVVTLFD